MPSNLHGGRERKRTIPKSPPYSEPGWKRLELEAVPAIPDQKQRDDIASYTASEFEGLKLGAKSGKSDQRPKEDDTSGGWHAEAMTFVQDSLINRLNMLYEKKHSNAIASLWVQAKQQSRKAIAPNGSHAPESSHPGQLRGDAISPEYMTDIECQKFVDVFNRFIMVFMGLRQPKKAVEVWNYMLWKGMAPGQASWHSMLNGCRQARDVEALEQVWQRMYSAGVRPDVGCWTTRISGLIACGKNRIGLLAFQEMVETWSDAAKKAMKKRPIEGNPTSLLQMGDVGDIVKPTIATINATVGALLRYRMGNEASIVMQTARSIGIENDIITYNTMLNFLVREGRLKEFSTLFHRMEASNVQPDITTFTILLDGMFRTSPDGQSSTSGDHLSAVMELLPDMEARGITASAHTYGVLIDRLLKNHSNPSAAMLVLDQMTSKGVIPTPPIFTSLMTYHFERAPPDLAAIEHLWLRIREQKVVVDHIFYDRMVEGYAGVGDTAKMLQFLGRMPREGMRPGPSALSAVVNALVAAGESDKAKEVMESASRQDRVRMGQEVEFRGAA
ncbi:MAG: hypothetical protein M1833_002084 [Piccolia ochrophora]|nr:MAG: hypothetical protein M1833_002084 [Piccolia ochrophora]